MKPVLEVWEYDINISLIEKIYLTFKRIVLNAHKNRNKVCCPTPISLSHNYTYDVPRKITYENILYGIPLFLYMIDFSTI